MTCYVHEKSKKKRKKNSDKGQALSRMKVYLTCYVRDKLGRKTKRERCGDNACGTI